MDRQTASGRVARSDAPRPPFGRGRFRQYSRWLARFQSLRAIKLQARRQRKLPTAGVGVCPGFVSQSALSMPRFFIKTYGCKMNERDSEQVAHSLLERGYERAEREMDADVVLLNTCSVRDMAEQKALGKMGMLGEIAKRRPETVFGFLGCMAQARGDSLFAAVPHLDLVVGTQKFHRVADYVEELLEKKRTRRMDDPRFSICDIQEESGSAETIRDHQVKARQP